MLSTQELSFNIIILWSAITDETKYEDTQDLTWWAEKIENYNLAGHPHALNFKNLRKYQMMSHKNTKLKAQNTNLDSPQIFLKAFHDETPSFSPLDWVLEIFKQKWNIKRNQMRVRTKYQRGVTTRQWGMKGQTSGCLNDYLLETDKFQKQLPRRGRSELYYSSSFWSGQF